MKKDSLPAAAPVPISANLLLAERMGVRHGLLNRHFVQKFFNPRPFQTWHKTSQQDLTRASRSGSGLYRTLLERYQPPVMRIQRRFGAAASFTNWQPLDLALPGGNSPAPVQAQQPDLSSLLAGTPMAQNQAGTPPTLPRQAPSAPPAGQVIPRKESDPDYAPNRFGSKGTPQPAKTPRLSPSHRLFSRVEEVIPDKTGASPVEVPEEPRPEEAPQKTPKETVKPVGETQVHTNPSHTPSAVVQREMDLPSRLQQPVNPPRQTISSAPALPVEAQTPIRPQLEQPVSPLKPHNIENPVQPVELPVEPAKKLPPEGTLAPAAPDGESTRSDGQKAQKTHDRTQRITARPVVIQREPVPPLLQTTPLSMPASLPAHSKSPQEAALQAQKPVHQPSTVEPAFPESGAALPAEKIPPDLSTTAQEPPTSQPEVRHPHMAARPAAALPVVRREIKPQPEASRQTTQAETPVEPVDERVQFTAPLVNQETAGAFAPRLSQPALSSALRKPERMAARPVPPQRKSFSVPAFGQKVHSTPVVASDIQSSPGTLSKLPARQSGMVQREFDPPVRPFAPRPSFLPLRGNARPMPGSNHGPSSSSSSNWQPPRSISQSQPVLGSHRPAGGQSSPGRLNLLGRHRPLPTPPPPPPSTAKPPVSPGENNPSMSYYAPDQPVGGARPSFSSLSMPMTQPNPQPASGQYYTAGSSSSNTPEPSASSDGRPAYELRMPEPSPAEPQSHPSSTDNPSEPESQPVSHPASSPEQENPPSALPSAALQPGSQASESVNIDQIARQVYPLILRKLSVDRERQIGRLR